ncbi:unnamed protein product [Calypogeia fissa]
MTLWVPCGAAPVSPRASPWSITIENALQQLRKDSRWTKGLVGTFILFACSYAALVLFLSGFGCSQSSTSNYNSGDISGAFCTLKSWSNAFSSNGPETPMIPIPVQEHNISQNLDQTKTSIDRILFGIGANDGSWTERRECIKLWWRQETRGFVWVDQNLTSWKKGDPPYKVSEDTSRFSYTHPSNLRSALRISRIVVESFRLGLQDVDWFVMGDDDTLFFTENLVQVLSKYDPRKMHYIGTHTEDTAQSKKHHYGVAFGGGGVAISYPLAKALSEGYDDCLERYSHVYGSDERVKACVSELGVPMTKELGFHQMDLRGDISGFLSAHPVSPIVSLHHLVDMTPIFYGPDRVEDLKRLMKAVEVDPASMFQQSICYDSEKKFSFSVSYGYVVEAYEGFISPRELEMAATTFMSWNWGRESNDFTFDTRPLAEVCNCPTRFFMVSSKSSKGDGKERLGTSSYKKMVEFEEEKCKAKSAPLGTVKTMNIEKEPLSDDWYQNPRRKCCRVTSMNSGSASIRVGDCGESESLVVGPKPEEATMNTRKLLEKSSGHGDFAC